MHTLLAGLALMAAAAAGAADRPPGCDEALQALDAAERATLAPSAPREAQPPAVLPVPSGLAAARKRAALACLGAAPSGAPRAPQDVPPVAVPPVTPLPRTGTEPRPAAPPPTPLPPATAPRVMSCDSAGCWLNDGSRVQRAGPESVRGPQGICSIRLGVLSCP
jgi:hypothetical protein